VQKVVAADGTDFPHRKESSHGQHPHLLADGGGIVMGRAKESLTAAIATEDEGADRDATAGTRATAR